MLSVVDSRRGKGAAISSVMMKSSVVCGHKIYDLLRSVADRLETVGHRYRVHVLEAVHDTYLAASWPALLAPADVADPLATDADVAREVRTGMSFIIAVFIR